jgi:hypothetical protein
MSIRLHGAHYLANIDRRNRRAARATSAACATAQVVAQAACRSPSTHLSQRPIWFQLSNARLAMLSAASVATRRQGRSNLDGPRSKPVARRTSSGHQALQVLHRVTDSGPPSSSTPP